MSCRGTRTLFFITIFLALEPACARKESASVERLAILSFENLSSNDDLGWIGRAAASAIVYDLTPARNIYAQNVESVTASHSMDATRVIQGYYFERDSRISFHVTVEDLRRTKMLDSFELDGPAGEGVFSSQAVVSCELSTWAAVHVAAPTADSLS